MVFSKDINAAPLKSYQHVVSFSIDDRCYLHTLLCCLVE